MERRLSGVAVLDKSVRILEVLADGRRRTLGELVGATGQARARPAGAGQLAEPGAQLPPLVSSEVGEAVDLQSVSQPVAGGARLPRVGHQLAQAAPTAVGQHLEDANRLVEDGHTAYPSFH